MVQVQSRSLYLPLSLFLRTKGLWSIPAATSTFCGNTLISLKLVSGSRSSSLSICLRLFCFFGFCFIIPSLTSLHVSNACSKQLSNNCRLFNLLITDSMIPKSPKRVNKLCGKCQPKAINNLMTSSTDSWYSIISFSFLTISSINSNTENLGKHYLSMVVKNSMVPCGCDSHSNAFAIHLSIKAVMFES